jgi:hypothetical protein
MKYLAALALMLILMAGCDEETNIYAEDTAGPGSTDVSYMLIVKTPLCEDGRRGYALTAYVQNAEVPEAVTWTFGDGQSEVSLSPPWAAKHFYAGCGDYTVTADGILQGGREHVAGSVTVSPCDDCP